MVASGGGGILQVLEVLGSLGFDGRLLGRGGSRRRPPSMPGRDEQEEGPQLYFGAFPLMGPLTHFLRWPLGGFGGSLT